MGLFSRNRKKVVIEKFKANSRTIMQLMAGNFTENFEVYQVAEKRTEALKIELWEACLEDKAMARLISGQGLNAKGFLEVFERLERLLIGAPAIAMAMSDPDGLSYIIGEDNDGELQSHMMTKYGNAW